MNTVNYCTDLFEPIPDYRKIVLLMFLIKNGIDRMKECGFLRNVINRLNKEFKFILLEQIEEYLDYTKIEEESIFEQISIK